jgi:hypothetical protein
MILVLAGVAFAALIIAAVALYRTLPGNTPQPTCTHEPVPVCIHEWTVRLKTIVEPIDEVGRIRGRHAYEVVKALMSGSTHAILTCSKCGAVREARVPGVPTT